MFRSTQQHQQRPSHQIGINSQVQVKTESCNSWMPGTPSHMSPNSKLQKFTWVLSAIFNKLFSCVTMVNYSSTAMSPTNYMFSFKFNKQLIVRLI